MKQEAAAATAPPEGQVHEACVGLARRLRAGEPARAEDFFQTYPALAARPDWAVELICAEFVTRRQLGRPGSRGEWFARFPQWREPLARRFEALDGGGPGDAATLPTASSAPATGAAPTLAECPPLLGRYELLAQLGRGTMGVVYKARLQGPVGRLVALKALRGGALAGQEEVERFYQEVRAAGGLNHRHLMPVYDVGEHAGQLFFTMPLAAGSLAQQVARFAADPAAAARLVEKVARAVDHAHRHHVLHRDLKPANILLDDEGEPLVADFGLARFLDDDRGLTETGRVLGTPAYLAPEQAAGRSHDVGPAGDVWSLGVILYELLTGRQPFTAPTRDALYRAIRYREPPCPHDVPRPLQEICLKCLEKGPARRYASAGAFADDLAKWLAGGRPGADGWAERGGRRLRRRLHGGSVRAAASLLALALGAALVTELSGARTPPADPTPTAQAREADEMMRDLEAGKRVELVNEDGSPRWAQWRLGKGEVVKPLAKDRSFGLQSAWDKPTLLELLPDPRRDHYRVRFQVQHQLAAGLGHVGLYFAHRPLLGRGGPEHRYVLVTLADTGKRSTSFHDGLEPCSGLQLGVRRVWDWNNGGSEGHDFRPHLFRPAERAWRTVELEITPEKVLVWFDGKPAAEVTWAQIIKAETYRRQGEPEPSPRGGLGVFALGSTARFRGLVVEPVP